MNKPRDLELKFFELRVETRRTSISSPPVSFSVFHFFLSSLPFPPSFSGSLWIAASSLFNAEGVGRDRGAKYEV